jgi:hypothetical protein
MAKAKRKHEATVKANDGAGGKPTKTRGRKKAAEAEEAVVAAPAPEPARAKKAGGRKKAAAADPTPEPARAKKAGGRKKAAAADPTPEPARAKKAGGRKKAAAADPTPEPARAKKAGGRKKAAEAVEAAPEPAKGKKESGKKKAGKVAKAKQAAEPTLAQRLDKHHLYQRAVQSPEADIEFFAERYKELRGREPKVLREDFCGTSYISATWAASAKGRRAIGVDLDTATLQWAREHNLAPLSKDAQKRVELRQANVLDGGGAKADVTCAMNFSYGVFKTRAELKHYFEVVFQQLADEGVFVTELYGGTEAIIAVQDEREIEGDDQTGGDFTYLWEQAAYNPITHETLCHIHFQLSDGSKIEKAFTYDWRLWSIAEVRELLYEVGFTSVRVYWESIDEDGDGTGEYHPSEEEENQEAWLVYLVAAK